MNREPLFFFRVDASREIGTGHVMRCLTLADELRRHGARCEFVCREHSGNMIQRLIKDGFNVHALPLTSHMDTDLAHSDWLGSTQAKDAQLSLRLLEKDQPEWLIVDHYGIDHRWESPLRSGTSRIMVIDDLADRSHDCDVLLDQNYGSSAERYAGLLPSDCNQFHGPKHALLRPIYAEHRKSLVPRDGQVHRVMIYFGGGDDKNNLTGMTLKAFEDPQLDDIQLDLVVGADYVHLASLEKSVARKSKARIYRQLPDLSELMSVADLAIGAGGATTWERCCMGLPSIVVSIAENQRPACESLARRGLIEYLGDSTAVTAQIMSHRIRRCLTMPERLRSMSAKAIGLVNGCGVNGIATVLMDAK